MFDIRGIDDHIERVDARVQDGPGVVHSRGACGGDTAPVHEPEEQSAPRVGA